MKESFPLRDARVVAHLGLVWNSPKQECPGFRDLSYLSSKPFVQTADMIAAGECVERIREVSPTTFLGVSEAMILDGDDPAKATQDELHDARHDPRHKPELHDTRHMRRTLGDPQFPTFDVGAHRVDSTPLVLPPSTDASEDNAAPIVLPAASDIGPRKPRRVGAPKDRAPAPAAAEAAAEPTEPTTWEFIYLYAPVHDQIAEHWRPSEECKTDLELYLRVKWKVKGSSPCVTWEPWANFRGQSDLADAWERKYGALMEQWKAEVAEHSGERDSARSTFSLPSGAAPTAPPTDFDCISISAQLNWLEARSMRASLSPIACWMLKKRRSMCLVPLKRAGWPLRNRDCALAVRVNGGGSKLFQPCQRLDKPGHLLEERAVVAQLAKTGGDSVKLRYARRVSNIVGPDAVPVEERRSADSHDALHASEVLAQESQYAVDAAAVVGVVGVVGVADDAKRDVVVASATQAQLCAGAARDVAADAKEGALVRRSRVGGEL